MAKFRQIMALTAMTLWLGLSNGEARAEDGATINIQTFQFQPKQLEVKAGTPVTWTNLDDIRHTVTSGTPEKKDGRFDATLAGKGAKFTFTFAQPGTYSFFCDRHQHMRGEIVVE